MGSGSLDLLGWRRATAETYRAVRERAGSDPEGAHALWRERRDELFSSHPSSPLPAGDPRRAEGLRYGAYDPAARFEVALEVGEPAAFTAVTGTDGEVGFERMGTVVLGGLGSLDVWWITGYGGGVWLPVRDGGSGSVSYGGGRYVLDTVKGADLGSVAGGRLVVDLNFSYAPSCAYDPEWACPLAPPGNRLAAVLEVGELG